MDSSGINHQHTIRQARCSQFRTLCFLHQPGKKVVLSGIAMSIISSATRTTNWLIVPHRPVFVQVFPAFFDDRTEEFQTARGDPRNSCKETRRQSVSALRATLRRARSSTYDLMNLGNTLIMVPPATMSKAPVMLRSIQSGLRPRVIRLRYKEKRRRVVNIHNGRPTKALLLDLQTIFSMTLNAVTLFHSRYFQMNA